MNRKQVILVFVLALGATQLFAKDIFVAKSGDDSNTGAIESPYLTISKAATMAIAGDNVYIREGSYEEVLNPTNSGVNGSPITFQGYNNETVIITAMQSVTGFTLDKGRNNFV